MEDSADNDVRWCLSHRISAADDCFSGAGDTTSQQQLLPRPCPKAVSTTTTTICSAIPSSTSYTEPTDKAHVIPPSYASSDTQDSSCSRDSTKSGASHHQRSGAGVLSRTMLSVREYRVVLSGVLFQSFLHSFELHLVGGTLGYVLAYFTASSLTSVLPTILQIVSATLVPFFTKVSDVIGRAEALTLAVVAYLVGYAVQGAAGNFGYFATGSIFTSIGNIGMTALIQILIADITPLLDRGMMFGLADVGAVFNIVAAQLLLDPLTLRWSWRWVYVLAILSATIGATAALVPLYHLQHKYQSLHNKDEEETTSVDPHTPQPGQPNRRRRSFAWFLRSFDMTGTLLLLLGLSLTLFPLTLAHTFPGNYRNPWIQLSLLSGLLLLAFFVVHQARFSAHPLLPRQLFTCSSSSSPLLPFLAVQVVLTFMAALNWEYFTLYLVVSRNLTFGQAMLLERGYQLAYLLLAPLTGLAIRRSRHCRRYIRSGILLVALGTLLMLPARHPSSPSPFVAISQAIVGAGAGMAHLAAIVALSALVAPPDLASAIGACHLLNAIAAALGGAIAGAVWSQLLPARLLVRLGPPDHPFQYDLDRVLNDPFYIQRLPVPIKARVIDAYSDSQMLLTVLSASLSIVAALCTVRMQRVQLDTDSQETVSNEPCLGPAATTSSTATTNLQSEAQPCLAFPSSLGHHQSPPKSPPCPTYGSIAQS